MLITVYRYVKNILFNSYNPGEMADNSQTAFIDNSSVGDLGM